MDIQIVRSDDWVGVYIDGELLDQGSELNDSRNLLELLESRILKIAGIHFDFKYANQGWLNFEGVFPEDISNVLYEDQQWEYNEKDME